MGMAEVQLCGMVAILLFGQMEAVLGQMQCDPLWERSPLTKSQRLEARVPQALLLSNLMRVLSMYPPTSQLFLAQILLVLPMLEMSRS